MMETTLIDTDNHSEATKKCPYCAERILDEAIKCRFCDEFLVKLSKPETKTKWYFSTHTVVFALLLLGPLALPLVFINPRYKIITKFVITIVVIAFTILFCYLTANMYLQLMKQIDQLGIR